MGTWYRTAFRRARAAAAVLAALACLGASAGNRPQSAPEAAGPYLADVVKALDQGIGLAESGRGQLALGRLDAMRYPQGVTLQLDPEGADAGDRRAFLGAMDAWRAALGPDCPLREGRAAGPVDVWVRMADRVPSGGDRELGLIQLERRVRYSPSMREVRVTGTIWVLRAHRGQATTEAERLHIVLHEIGHLLGLDDVPRPGPLMGPMRRGETLDAVPEAEAEQVRRLRTALRDRTTQVEGLMAARR